MIKHELVRNSVSGLLLCCVSLLFSFEGWSQNFPTPKFDATLLPSSPNAQSSVALGNSLQSGNPSFGFPIYEVKCGSLSLPVSLGYNYQGFYPLQDAGWVGLGWNLSAGGVISRIIQGTVDSTRPAGYNYGEYSISDSLFQTNNNTFLGKCYSNDSTNTYDVAPDIFSFSFNGYVGQFYRYNGKIYFLSYNKEIKVDWPSSTGDITIITGDGTSYIFGAKEKTFLGVGHNTGLKQYTSAWNLTKIISADRKDSIGLTYSTYTWRQYPSPYNATYVQGTTQTIQDLGETVNYVASPLILANVLQSIDCRTAHVNFIPSSSARIDIDGNSPLLPSLGEINVTDAITGALVKKNTFTYGYFGDPMGYTISTAWLKLKQLSDVDITSTGEVHTYTFDYNNEANDFTFKGTFGIDYWGLYNGASNSDLFPTTLPFGSADREPNFSKCSFGSLSAVHHPSGAYSTYEYELNDYYSSSAQANKSGPGIRVKSISQFEGVSGTLISKKKYFYREDDGTTSSGTLLNVPNFAGPAYSIDANTYNTYVAFSNAAGAGIVNNVFYYKKVTEQIDQGNEIHKSAYYFTSFSNLYNDVELTKKVDYRYDVNSSTFKPLLVSSSIYSTVTDTSFLIITPYVRSANQTFGGAYNYTYNYTYSYQPTYWKYLTQQKTVSYDKQNDSLTTSTLLYYGDLRNMDSTIEMHPDGRKIIEKYKYPDEYVSSLTGPMVAKNMVSAVIEKQRWIQMAGAPAKLIAGEIKQVDQTIFKPITLYALETSAGLASLSNEMITNGKYATLLSDANYGVAAQYSFDANNNLIQFNKVSDIPISHIYDYNNSIQIAEISNAAANQAAYTSFEADGSGGWTIPSLTRDATTAFTGSKSYNLSSGAISFGSLNTGNSYVLTYWSKNGAYTLSNGAGYQMMRSANGWTNYEHIITNVSSITISGSGNIDELRLLPTTAQMVSYTVKPLVGVISSNNGISPVTYYEYDGFNRIKNIKDVDRNILKVYQYKYDQPYTYTNDAASGSFVKSCPCGQVGSTVVYTVPANTYTSHGGKEDANLRAKNDVLQNGQAYANSNGTCTPISCSGTDKKIVNCVCETGTKVYTSSVWQPIPKRYLCTYHYEWSDGAWSSDYTELSTIPCQTN